MSSFTQFCRLSNYAIGSYKSILHRGSNWVSPIQISNYAKKSAEEKLGLDKPKRPLTPFFKFMGQMRPAIQAKNPGITSKEAIAWTSRHWQELDAETKAQMSKEYEKDIEDYKKIKAIYESSLTDQQKEDIKRLKDEMSAVKEKRKLKAEFKEMGRPRRPMSSYFLFSQTRREKFDAKNVKEFQEKLKTEWVKLPPSEKVKYEKQAQDLMIKFKKDLDLWELKMISMGRTDLVRTRPLREKKPKSSVKSQ